MNKQPYSVWSRYCRHSHFRALAAGIALALLVLALPPRDDSERVLAVDLAGEHCEYRNVFVGDQLIRVGTSCKPGTPDSRPAL